MNLIKFVDINWKFGFRNFVSRESIIGNKRQRSVRVVSVILYKVFDSQLVHKQSIGSTSSFAIITGSVSRFC